MPSIVFYSTNQKQVDPNPDRSTGAPAPFDEIINYNVELYVDPRELKVAALIYAETTAAGNRKRDSFYAIYHGEQKENLLSNFATALDKIDDGEVPTDHEWTFLHEETENRYELIWFARDASYEDLSDLGLTYVEQLSVEQLASDGQKTDFAVDSYRSGAIAANHLLKQGEVKEPFAIHSSGRQPPLKDTSFVLKPENGVKNFEGRNADTKKKFSEQKENLKSTIVNLCQTKFYDYVDDLHKQPIWTTEYDLRKVRSGVKSSSSWQLQSKSGRSLIGLIDTVSDGGVVDKKYDTAILNEVETQNLIEWFERKIDKEIESIESKDLQSLYIDEAKESIDEVENFDLYRRYELLGDMLSILESGKKTNSSVSESVVSEIKDIVDQIDASPYFDPNQQRNTINNLSKYVRKLRSDCVTEEKRQIEELFRKSRTSTENRSIKRRARWLVAARSALNNIQEGSADSFDEKRIPKYCETISRLEENPILNESHKEDIIDDEESELEEMQSEIREDILKESTEEIKEFVNQRRTEFVSVKSEITFLLGVSQTLRPIVSVRADENELSQEIFDSLEELNEMKGLVEERDILDDQSVRRKFRELQREYESEIDDLRAQYVGDYYSNDIEEIDRIVETEPPSEAYVKLNKKKRRLNQTISNSRDVPESRTTGSQLNSSGDKETIQTVDSPFGGKQILPEEAIEQEVMGLIDKIEDEQEKLQEQYEEVLKTQFKRVISNILSSNIDLEKQLEILVTIKSGLQTRDNATIKGSDFLDDNSKAREQIDWTDLQECVGDVNGGEYGGILQTSKKRDLRREFRNTVTDEISTIAEDLTPKLSEGIQNHITREVLPGKPDDDLSIDEIKSARDDLSAIKSKFKQGGYKEGTSTGIVGMNRVQLQAYRGLPPKYQRKVSNEVTSWIDSHIPDYEAKYGELTYQAYSDQFEQICNLNNRIDRIVGLKQFRRILHRNRTTWPDKCDPSEYQDPTRYRLENTDHDFDSQVAEKLEEETEQYVNKLQDFVDDVINDFDEQGPYSVHPYDELQARIKSKHGDAHKDLRPILNQYQTIQTKLGKFGTNDETLQRLQNEILRAIEKRKSDVRTPSTEGQSGPASNAATSGRANKRRGDTDGRASKGRKDSISTAATITLVITAAGVLLLLLLIIVFIGPTGFEDLSGPGAGDDPAAAGTFAIGSLAFADNVTHNQTATYELEYSVVGIKNGSSNANHTVLIEGIETVDPEIQAETGDGRSVPISDTRVTSISNTTTSSLEFQTKSPNNTTSSDIRVSLVLELRPANVTLGSSQGLTVVVANRSGESINRSTEYIIE